MITLAGTGAPGCSGDNVPALSATLSGPSGLALDKPGANLYIADQGCDAVRKVNLATGMITTVAGTLGTEDVPLADGGPATSAELFQPNGVALDAHGNLYIADSANYRVRQVNTNGIINTIAGTGLGGLSGDGGPATSAQFDWPYRISVAPNGTAR